MMQVTPLIQITPLQYCRKLIIILTVNIYLLVVKFCNVNILGIDPIHVFLLKVLLVNFYNHGMSLGTVVLRNHLGRQQ